MLLMRSSKEFARRRSSLDGLHQIVLRAQRDGSVDDLIVRKIPHDDERTLLFAAVRLLHHREPVEPLQKEAQDDKVGICAFDERDALLAAARHAADFPARTGFRLLFEFFGKRFVALQDQYALRLHILPPNR